MFTYFRGEQLVNRDDTVCVIFPISLTESVSCLLKRLLSSKEHCFQMFTIAIFLVLVQCIYSAPSVSLPLGTVTGLDYNTITNVPAEIFLGIPFARPPTGSLRFEVRLTFCKKITSAQKPQDPVPFGHLNATKFGNICIPHTRRAIPANYTASEDCLTMNIIRPKNRVSDLPKPISWAYQIEGNLPVLVWVHGGGYEIGSASVFGYTGYADNYIPQDIIVVTFQYRLGVHGFLSVGIPEMNGNFGAFDQAKAIE